MGLLRRELYNDTQNTYGQVFAIFSHPGRTKTILMLVINDSLTLSQIKDQLGLSQSSTSEIVKKLRQVGLITGKEVGTSVRYSLNWEMWQSMLEVLQYFLNEVSNPSE